MQITLWIAWTYWKPMHAKWMSSKKKKMVPRACDSIMLISILMKCNCVCARLVNFLVFILVCRCIPRLVFTLSSGFITLWSPVSSVDLVWFLFEVILFFSIMKLVSLKCSISGYESWRVPGEVHILGWYVKQWWIKTGITLLDLDLLFLCHFYVFKYTCLSMHFFRQCFLSCILAVII